jgi:hypothetical protein
MRVGLKSLLFGVHQFAYHPVIVARAWRHLYGRWPNWREAVCILVHDWGYWCCDEMDSEDGENHPVLGAEIVRRLFGPGEHVTLVLLHSRHLARRLCLPPSELCWPDKFSVLFDPPWFYLLRARLSGELAEYRRRAAEAGFVPLSASDDEWMAWLRDRFERLARERRGDVVPYVNPAREVAR